jgi:hypothetical protein
MRFSEMGTLVGADLRLCTRIEVQWKTSRTGTSISDFTCLDRYSADTFDSNSLSLLL